jgi:MoaD family protein
MYPQFIIRVNFYGVLREITGKKSDEIQLESGSLSDLLGVLAKRYGDPFESYFFTSKTLSPQVNIFLNHTVIQFEKIAEITLHHRDQLDLFAPVSGG